MAGEKHESLPIMGIVIYRDDQGRKGLECFRIEGHRFMNPFIPKQEHLRAIADACDASSSQGDLCGDVRSCISISGKSMLFWVPPKKRTILLSDGTGEAKRVKVWVPMLLFSYQWSGEHQINVFWTKATPLDMVTGTRSSILAAPCEMPNIDNEGVLCIGNSMDRVTYSESISRMQNSIVSCFFNSTFNEWRTNRVGPVMAAMKKAHTMSDEKASDCFWNSAIMKKVVFTSIDRLHGEDD